MLVFFLLFYHNSIIIIRDDADSFLRPQQVSNQRLQSHAGTKSPELHVTHLDLYCWRFGA